MIELESRTLTVTVKVDIDQVSVSIQRDNTVKYKNFLVRNVDW